MAKRKSAQQLELAQPNCLLKPAKHTDKLKVVAGSPKTLKHHISQALRAARDRERSQLRALIAQKRGKPINKLKDGGGGGGGDEENLNGDAPRDDPFESFLEWGSPRNRVVAVGGARPPATEPPLRRPERLRSTPPHGTVAPGGKAVGVDGSAGSVDASRCRRRPRSKNPSSGKRNDGGAGEADAHRDPANRHQQSLRDFIAESRRNRQKRQQSQDLGDEEDDISVVVAAPGPGRIGGLLAAAPPERESNFQVPKDGGEVAAAAGPRRNIGREFDVEDRTREGVGAGGGGPENGQVGGRRGRSGDAPKGGIPEPAEGGSVEDDKCERGGDIDRGSRPSSRSSSSSSPQREQFPENGTGDGQAVGAMEGVPPGLATYDSQRSAAGMDGGGRAGQEEYARMLELMQKVRP